MNKILITGTSSGIGFSLAKFFLNKEFTVYGVSRNIPKINNSKYIHFNLDLSDINNLKNNLHFFKDLEIENFIHNAGMIGELKNFNECDLEIWEKTLNVNLTSGIFLLNGILESIIKKKGCIIFMAGGGSTTSLEKWSAYSTSKTGVVRFIENIADEYKNIIRAYALSPGVNKTKIMKDAMKQGYVYDETKIVSPDLSCKLCDFLINKKEFFLSGRQIHVKDDYSNWKEKDLEITAVPHSK